MENTKYSCEICHDGEYTDINAMLWRIDDLGVKINSCDCNFCPKCGRDLNLERQDRKNRASWIPPTIVDDIGCGIGEPRECMRRAKEGENADL